MDSVKIQHNVIKKAQTKEYFTLSLSGLFSYPNNPSSKRVARCTNIPHTGALPTVKGVGQRLRKGLGKWRRVTRRGNRIDDGNGWSVKIEHYTCASEDSTPNTIRLPVIAFNVAILPTFLSLSSAAEIRHSARNTRL